MEVVVACSVLVRDVISGVVVVSISVVVDPAVVLSFVGTLDMAVVVVSDSVVIVVII